MTDIMGAKKAIAELRQEIERHNRLYYVEARPELSDFDFDRLLEQLIAIERQFPELVTPDSPSQRVGGTITREIGRASCRERVSSPV